VLWSRPNSHDRPESKPIAQRQSDEGRPVLAETRRREIANALRDAGAVTVSELEARFGVSAMTARRDLIELERRGLVRRTHGGAVLPTASAHEDSFARRLGTAATAKRRLAEEAVARLAPRQTVYLDSSTTAHFVARRMVDTGIEATILTNSLPIMDLVFGEGGAGLDLIAVGGNLRRLTRSFVGPFAVRTVQGHFADRLFLSIKGLTATGMLTDADPLEAEVKRTMIAQAGESILLIDDSKLTARGLSVISSLSEVSGVLADGLSSEQVETLRSHGASAIHQTGARERADGEGARPRADRAGHASG
jgi:DeoR/GlpR family transcriptional regulator of sugar metabolism